jgi:histidinol-phosphate/aromatic aminotransferase/cobyric acid decarboxylase-like protein/adenosyl cobinamide kinase/adenosyl cobinamide phosphate guanylyltransferase
VALRGCGRGDAGGERVSVRLVIGGTRSGKSAHAERLALASGLRVRYVATADASDPAMAERIDAHAARRPAQWTTVEAGRRLADAVAGASGMCVLVDGLGVWMAGAMHRAGAFDGEARDGAGRANGDGTNGGGTDALSAVRAAILVQVDELLEALGADDGPALMIVVAEQSGEGTLPADGGSRAWVDVLGETTQRMAARADRVELVVAGRALELSAGTRSSAAADGLALLRRHGDRDVRPGDADHAVNVLAGGPPEWLREALREALERDASVYPDERAACEALAALHGRGAAEMVATNGGAEALWLLPAALRPTLVACVHPGFTEAEAAMRAHGVPVVRVVRERERDFVLDPRAVPAEADVVIVGNPASPSGTLDPAAAILELRRPGRVVVVDEAFMDLVPGEAASLVRERLDDVVVVRSLTKALAIPGLRAGYAVAGERLAERVRAVRPPWSANALALAALTAAAGRPRELAALADRAQAEREDLERRLGTVAGVRTWSSATNFCLLEVADGPAVLAGLRERRVAVRPAASFPGLGLGDVRVTARDPAANERLVAALVEAVAEASSSSSSAAAAAAAGSVVGTR